MGVDDAGGRALQSASLGPDALAALLDFLAGHPPHGHADVVAAERMDPLQCLPLRLVLRHNPLACPPVSDAVPVAEGIQQVLAAETQLRLEARLAVVDACVDHLAVARAGLGAHGRVTLNEHGGGAGLEGELAGDGETDDAAADDLDGIMLVDWTGRKEGDFVVRSNGGG